MKYTTFWSVLETPAKTLKPEMIFLSVAIVFVIAWIAILKFKKFNDKIEKAIMTWTLGLIFGFSLTSSIYFKFFVHDNSEIEATNKMLATAKIIEGHISNFKREYRRSVTIESFQVDSVGFRYEDAMLGRFNSFSKTNNHVFHNGLPVRITYVEGNQYYGADFTTLLKIEVGSE